MKKRGRFAGRWEKLALVAILLLAAALRVVALNETPPGLQQDEAANAWNAWCLLHTGRDQIGTSWPIFYIRALGENRTTPHVYAIMAFQAIGGMNVWTTRLPIAIAGIATVLLLYVVGKRLFGPYVGLLAAALLAVNPWHNLLVRQGVQTGLCPFIVTGVLAAMLWAKLPLTDEKTPPRPGLAVLAGLFVGAGCYGYFAVRMFLPVFLTGIVLVGIRHWWNLLKTRRGALAVAGFILGVAVTLGPLAWRHLTDPAMGKRGQDIYVWEQEDSAIAKIGKALARYPEHFGPTFLFLEGDPIINHSVPDWGQFHWYTLPFMLVGLGVILWRSRKSLPARVLLVWVLVYPAGDLIAQCVGPHAPRSSPGLCALILLAGVGAVAAGGWLYRRWRRVTLVAACVAAIAPVVLTVWFFYTFFGSYSKLPKVYHLFQTDMKEACEWLRPRLDEFDVVFCTTNGMNQPYITMLTHLRYDPHKWHTDEKELSRSGEWDKYYRFAKFRFLYRSRAEAMIQEFARNGRRSRAVFIVRPWELGNMRPRHVVRRPSGEVVLWICPKVF